MERRRQPDRRRSFALSRILIIVAAATAFAVVALHGITGYRATRAIIDQFAEAQQDADTIVAIDRVLDDVVNAETEQRQIDADLGTVGRLTAAEPEQQKRLRTLRVAIHENLMGTVRRTAHEMRDHEEAERTAARAVADASSRRVLRGIVIATSVAALLLLLTFAQVEIAGRASRRAREESESANRMKDQFLATVSHELRTPLTAILGWSAILSGNDVDAQMLHEGLATIQRTASVQKKLIEDLLDVSRIQSGKLRLSMRTLELAEAVRAAVDSMRPAADAKSIAIATHLERGIRISGDPDRLQQIVWNIITNAVKFTPRGGRIEVSVARIDSLALIEIGDSGEGIDLAFLPHVFEPFQQSDSSRARVHKGLGLGLSIVKYLVEAHGGTVSIRSDGQGKGTTLRVLLPTTDSAELASAIA